MLILRKTVADDVYLTKADDVNLTKDNCRRC